MKPNEIPPVFVALWIALAIAGMWISYGSRNAKLKKRLIPLFVIGSGILFAIFFLVMTRELLILLVFGPAVALISWMNLRMIRVCDSCGRTVYNPYWFKKGGYCVKCGAKLQA